MVQKTPMLWLGFVIASGVAIGTAWFLRADKPHHRSLDVGAGTLHGVGVNRQDAALHTRQTKIWTPSDQYPYSLEVQNQWQQLDKLRLQHALWTADEVLLITRSLATPVRAVPIPDELTWDDIGSDGIVSRAIGALVERAQSGRPIEPSVFMQLETQVVGLLDAPSASVRLAALSSLSQLGTPYVVGRVADKVRRMTQDADPVVASVAGRVVADLHDPAIIAASRNTRVQYGVE